MGCGKKMTQTVPTKYDYKVLETTCGSTNWYGEESRCDDCSQVRPWYICKHGRDVSQVDCPRCEFDE